MFEGMKVIAHRDIAVGLAAAAILGGAIATTVYEQYSRWQERRAIAAARPELRRPPVVERKSATETEVLFQLRIDGRNADCRLWIDQRSKTRSFSC